MTKISGSHSKISYHKNGKLKNVTHYFDNQFHNENGPAFQSWYENGQIEIEEYFINGRLNNPNGPAIQTWYENGQIKCIEYWFFNRNYTTLKELQRAVKMSCLK